MKKVIKTIQYLNILETKMSALSCYLSLKSVLT